MTSYANDTTATAAAVATTTAPNAGTAAPATAATAAAASDAVTPASAVGAAATLPLNSKQVSGHEDDNNSLDGREKADTTPENIKKIAEIISDKEAAAAAAAVAAAASETPSLLSPRLQQQQQQQQQLYASGFVGLGAAIDESNAKFCFGKPPPSPAEKAAVLSRAHQQSSHSNNSNNSNKSNRESCGAEEDESTATNSTTGTKQSLAFTIDHFDASANDAAAQAARYKNMMERFQSRHRRGASMSKLESEGSTANGSASASASGRHSQRSSLDASSMADDGSLTAATPTTELAPAVKMRVRERSASRVRDASKRHSWSPRSSATAAESTGATGATGTARPPSQKATKQPPLTSRGGGSGRTAGQFTPRSTAMQLALQQVELLCPQPPLDDLRSGEQDAVSEAGTYTLDGDNYTEEQKDLMNIDRNAAAAAAAAAAAKIRPKQLTVKPSRASNVLEVNYYHETPLQEQQQQQQQQQQQGQLEQQLKARAMRPQPAATPPAPPTPPSPQSPAADIGCFTSVTTSGVLAKQRALDTHPKLTRHTHSLSTSQIDSSEYVSNEARLRHAQALAGSATDRQKAEYRLNVFTSSNSQTQHQHQQQHQLPDTPTTPTPTEAALLQSAPTKQDWIQEWARNARARSLAQDVVSGSSSRRKQQAQLMTRSYNCSDTGGDSLTDDSLSLYSQQLQLQQQQQQQQQQRQYAAAAKLNRNLAERYRLLSDCDYASDPALCSSHNGGQSGQQGGEPYKPPKSPSKIPSPLHTLGRARSASRSRPSIEPSQSTATSRRSSVKSPAAQSSPQHSLAETTATAGATGYRRSPLHRALMTSSINEAQLQLLTSGDYLLKQLHRRKNSLDDVEHDLPAAGCVSPLRRSSSFQQQQLQLQRSSLRQARPNFQNLYTPPGARQLQQQQQQQQQQLQMQQQLQQQLKKSASSNNFEQAYCDYDNELQYYINDEDELGTTGPYYSSNEEEEEQSPPPPPPQQQQSAVPLSNTRLNKALLMRIERSKQRVAGSGLTPPAKPSSAPAGKLTAAGQTAAAAGAGLMACPNTPELPRRGIRSAVQPRAVSGCGPKLRQSMPRDTSLSRLAQQVPSSLANAKKQLLQTAHASNARDQRVQPKYLDISKYKSAQSNNFLRKNDAKSTLKPAEQMKRSPSASSMGLSRAEGTRASNRSVRSNTSVMNTSTTSLGGGGGGGGGGGVGGSGMRASSAVRRDASVNKQKEAEMVMWKRRSTYDPMKAAAEDRRRKEQARRAHSQALVQAQAQAQTQAQTQAQMQTQRQYNDLADELPFESVLRPANNLTITGSSIGYSPRNSMENDAWTLGESSEFGEYVHDYDDDDDDEEEEEEVEEEEEEDEEDVDDDDEEECGRDDYVAGQESDEVFEAETAQATS